MTCTENNRKTEAETIRKDCMLNFQKWEKEKLKPKQKRELVLGKGNRNLGGYED